MALDIAKIRNIGIVGHGGVGKTSLVEGMLFAAGAVNRLGRVDDGTTTTDFDPDEIKRKISLSTSAAYCDYKGHRLNFVDTPGYGDFISDARAGPAGGGRGHRGRGRGGGRAGPDREGLEDGQRLRAPAHRGDQQDGPGAGRLFSHAGFLQRRLKGRLCPLQVPIGAEAGFQGWWTS
jgi:elongation factor G